MPKFVFVLTTGTENPSKGVRCMQLAAIAKEEGHDVNVFLTDDAVFYGKQGMADNIVATTGDDMNTHLEKLARAQVPFYV
jgi:predicted peroxiredoxin